MAKGDRWSDDPNVEVREMRNAETILGVIRELGRRPFIENGRNATCSKQRPLASCLRSKDSRAVLRGRMEKVLPLVAHPSLRTPGLARNLASRLPYRIS